LVLILYKECRSGNNFVLNGVIEPSEELRVALVPQ